MKYALRDWERVTKLFAKRHVLTVICIIILLIPFILRFNLMAGEDNYYNIRIAENIAGGIYYDKLSYGGRDIIPTYGWPLLLFAFKKILFNIPYELIATSLTLLFTLGSFLLFYSLTKNMKSDIKLFSSLFLIISPAFLYLSTNSFSAVVFLMLMSVYLLSKERINLSLVTFAAIAFFSVFGAFVSLVSMLFYCLYIKRNKLFLKYLAAIFAASLIYAPFLLKHGLPDGLTFSMGSGFGYALKRVIFDLGGYGIALFALLLSFFGLRNLWNEKYKSVFFYTGFIALLILSYYFDIAVYYLTLLVSIAASYGFVYLIKRKWHNSTIKKFVIFIFALGLLFSTLSFFNQFGKELPNKDIIDGLKFLKDRDGVVLSNYDKGIWINSISGNKNVLDDDFYYAPNVNNRFLDVQSLFSIRDIEEARWIFGIYHINYVFIDSDMKNKIWSENEEGLLFLLKYSKEFRKVYSNNGVEIWEYLQ